MSLCNLLNCYENIFCKQNMPLHFCKQTMPLHFLQHPWGVICISKWDICSTPEGVVEVNEVFHSNETLHMVFSTAVTPRGVSDS